MSQTESSLPPKRPCPFCGGELDAEFTTRANRKRWMLAAVSLLGVAVLSLIASAIFELPVLNGLAMGIVIATSVLNIVFVSYVRKA